VLVVTQLVFHFPGVYFHVLFEVLTSVLSERAVVATGHWRVVDLGRVAGVHDGKLQVLDSI
jgi:hypothetical protein